MQRKPKVLFFSTGSAVRSQMAEGFLRRISGGQMEGRCTAVRPESNPLAAEVMKEVGIDVSENQPDDIKKLFQEHFTCVVTLSDDAKERSPVWPFTRNLLHWSLVDPSAAEGSPEQRREAFRRVRDEIQRNVRDFAAKVAPALQGRAAVAGR
jgi:protein-tyrosine-phosphatase